MKRVVSSAELLRAVRAVMKGERKADVQIIIGGEGFRLYVCGLPSCQKAIWHSSHPESKSHALAYSRYCCEEHKRENARLLAAARQRRYYQQKNAPRALSGNGTADS